MAEETPKEQQIFDHEGKVRANEQLDPTSSRETKNPRWINIVGRTYVKKSTLSGEGRTADTFIVTAEGPAEGPAEGSSHPTDFPHGDLVLKVPKFDFSQHSLQETIERFEQIRGHANFEFRDAAVKLNAFSPDESLRVPHINPILDKFNIDIDDIPAPLTIQRLLSSDKYTPLRDWMNSGGGRSPKCRDLSFYHLAISIAHAIEVIHSRRVIHGDINPDNVFLSALVSSDGAQQPVAMPAKDCFDWRSYRVSATLIDLGESFPSYPGRYYRARREHPFLAPECLTASRRSEAIDVYSFGRLLIYLYNLDEHSVLNSSARQSVAPSEWIEQRIRLDSRKPAGRRLVNLVARCLSQSPIERPRMSDVVDDLTKIANDAGVENIMPCHACERAGSADERMEAKKQLSFYKDKLLIFASATASATGVLAGNRFFNGLLDLEVNRLAAMYSGLARGALEVTGTRDHILNALAQVFYCLKCGDSVTVATSLDMWQREGLGLGGRLGAAVLQLAHNGAMLRRALLVSVEELGLPFVEILLAEIRSTLKKQEAQLGHQRGRKDPGLLQSNAAMQKLFDSLIEASGAYCGAIGLDAFGRSNVPSVARHISILNKVDSIRGALAKRLECPSAEQRKRNAWHQDRLRRILWTIRALCRDWELERHLDRRPLERKRRSDRSHTTEFWAPHLTVGQGNMRDSILFALLPVGTDADVEKERADNPAAIISWGTGEAHGAQKWLLATIDGIGSRTDVHRRRDSGLHLDRLRLHTSVHGDPVERRLYLARIFERSANMGACHEVLLNCVVAARKKYQEWEKEQVQREQLS